MSHTSDQESIGPSRLRVAVRAPAGMERVAELLGSGRGAWLGEPIPGDEPETTHHLVDLELRVIEHAPRVAFHKASQVTAGQVQVNARSAAVRLPLSWRAASMVPLFPVFAGTLVWHEDELRLDGFYEPPGGNVGVLMDRLLLNAAAQATGRRLLERIAEVLREG